MSAWVGGLPPAAAARVARQRASGATGSFLSAPAAAAVAAAGLVPAGEVFGCLVQNIGWTGGLCGNWSGMGGIGPGGWGWTSPVVTTGDPGGNRNGSGPYVRAVEGAWHGALHRMLLEAAALEADGVVGVVVRRSTLQGTAVEFTATGTAVRTVARTAPPPTSPWATDLTAEDCAAALQSGVAPRALLLGLSVATKHEDPLLSQQRMSWSGQEVDGLTELVTRARADARRRLAADARRHTDGGGQVVVSGIGLTSFETVCNGNAKDLHAEAVFTGTLLQRDPSARATSTAGRRVLTVLPLNR
ncbi:heavy metal-binding domain-containing protein [Kineococcus sp. NPDC059986]|uniref:heavy metal-binding domain-containing protein n=1 Tax=Kineococcus sp. NPDC059986 TaxID=3155538 RepID=UPI00344F6A21